MREWVDVHLGERIREFRRLRGISQAELGKRIGVSFQQIQKYETGLNRVGASRLWRISQVLETRIECFFEELVKQRSRNPASPDARTLRIAREIETITDDTLKKRVLDLVRFMARQPQS
ncbi:MAG: helix-turn-helix transcriptional regulator [Pseudomonadota bacterium]